MLSPSKESPSAPLSGRKTTRFYISLSYLCDMMGGQSGRPVSFSREIVLNGPLSLFPSPCLVARPALSHRRETDERTEGRFELIPVRMEGVDPKMLMNIQCAFQVLPLCLPFRIYRRGNKCGWCPSRKCTTRGSGEQERYEPTCTSLILCFLKLLHLFVSSPYYAVLPLRLRAQGVRAGLPSDLLLGLFHLVKHDRKKK